MDTTGLHAAYRRGDLTAVRTALGDPPNFPNCRGPRGMGEIILEYAIYWSPLPFVRTLLELGADANYGEHAGFPSLIAALSASRGDRAELIRLLLSFGADIEQRGVNDYTPLHWAAANNDPAMIELLLAEGADADRADQCRRIRDAARGGRAPGPRSKPPRRSAPSRRIEAQVSSAGAKNAKVRTSMLSRGAASAGAVGSANAVCAEKRARRASES